MTYTYVTMDVSPAAYEEIKQKLIAADYGHALHEDREDGVLLDMHGIALKLKPIDPGIITPEQQRELDAWVAGNEPDSASAAEAIRQGNWTWQEYQEHLKARKVRNGS